MRRDDDAILERIEDARPGLTEGPSIFRLLVCRPEHEQKREKEGKGFFYYRSSALSFSAADVDASAGSSALPVRGISPGSRCTKLIMPAWLSSSKERRERVRSAMVQVKLMALDKHPSCLHP